MALTLNTSHPLYGNLICCIAVENGALVDLLTPSRTFTPASGTSFGTGAYGEHFQSASSGNFAPLGATISPAIEDATTTTPNQTIFAVFNDITSVFGNSAITNASANKVTIGVAAGGFATAATNNVTGPLVSTTVVLNNGAKSVALSRTGETSAKIYVDGALEDTENSRIGFNSTDTTNYIGGYLGQGKCEAKIVWFVKFNKTLSDAEVTDLHASLGADNTFALVTSAGPATVTSAIAAGLPTPSATSTLNVQSTTISFTVAAGLPVPSASSAVTIVPAAGDPIFTSDPLHDNTDTLLANAPLDYVAIYDNTTGALVLRVTGISTNASGQFSVQSALLTSGVTYKVDWKVISQLSARMPAKAAV